MEVNQLSIATNKFRKWYSVGDNSDTTGYSLALIPTGLCVKAVQ